MQTNFTRITRSIHSDKITWPALLPGDLAGFVRQHNDLVLEGDSLTLAEFAERIRQTSTSGKDFFFASRLTVWADFMLELDSRLSSGDPLPAELTHTRSNGQTVTYCQAVYKRLLGLDALNYLQRSTDQWHPDWAMSFSKVA